VTDHVERQCPDSRQERTAGTSAEAPACAEGQVAWEAMINIIDLLPNDEYRLELGEAIRRYGKAMFQFGATRNK
jgi:hypothetical protein